MKMVCIGHEISRTVLDASRRYHNFRRPFSSIQNMEIIFIKMYHNYPNYRSRTCTDINECALHRGKGDCDHMCTNSAGSFKCSCHAGYVLSIDGLTCQDIDECAVNNGGCNYKCINTAGNYSCACNDGFMNKGRNGSDYICEDIGKDLYIETLS